MIKYQVTGKKLPKDSEGELIYAVGSIIEAANRDEFAKQYPSLVGKVSKSVEVASPNAELVAVQSQVAKAKAELKKVKAEIAEAKKVK